jgi:hypothetical protein
VENPHGSSLGEKHLDEYINQTALRWSLQGIFVLAMVDIEMTSHNSPIGHKHIPLN